MRVRDAFRVGVIVLRKQGGRFVQGSAAHFNQLWSNANLWQTAWQQIGNSLGAGPGEIYAFILANASWSENWIQNSLLPNIEPELTTLGVATERYCYRSTQTTNAFFVRSDGALGEPFNGADFPH